MKNSLVKSDNSGKTLTDFQSFENGSVDVKDIDGELWFCAKDVANAIEYKGNLNHWERWLDEEDRLKAQNGRTGQARNMTYISESALYRVLIKTDVPKAKPFERWVTKIVIPSIRKNGSYSLQCLDPVREKEIGLARAEFLRSMALEYNGKSETYKQVLDAYAVKELAGEFILPLPEVKQKSYSAGEVGKMLGISANKVGSIANKNNLKTEEFGHWVHDKSPYSGKEVESFRYYDNAVAEIKKILEEVAKKEEKK